jgi:hypothetical protein
MNYSERQYQKLLQNARLEQALASLDKTEAEPQSTPVPSVESLKPTPDEIRECVEELESNRPHSNLKEVCTGRQYAKRGVHQGGRRRVTGWFFDPITRAMADGKTTFKEACRKLGLHFSEKDEAHIRQLKEFKRMRNAYQRLFTMEAWGKPNEREVFEMLCIREDVKTPPETKPRRPRCARYISRVREPLI